MKNLLQLFFHSLIELTFFRLKSCKGTKRIPISLQIFAMSNLGLELRRFFRIKDFTLKVSLFLDILIDSNFSLNYRCFVLNKCHLQFQVKIFVNKPFARLILKGKPPKVAPVALVFLLIHSQLNKFPFLIQLKVICFEEFFNLITEFDLFYSKSK